MDFPRIVFLPARQCMDMNEENPREQEMFNKERGRYVKKKKKTTKIREKGGLLTAEPIKGLGIGLRA